MGEGNVGPNPFAPPSEQADQAVHYATDEYRLASLGQRFLGQLIDNLILLVSLAPALAVLAVSGDEPDLYRTWLPIGGSVLVFLGLNAYQWYLVSTRGQSLAKIWLRMRIIKENGELPGFVTGVIVRSWVIAAASAIPAVGSFVGLADGLAIFYGNRRQTLHDRIAGTLVIEI